MSDAAIPEHIDVSDEFLNELAKPDPKLASGWYRALCTRAERRVGRDPKKMTLYIQLSFEALADENDSGSRDRSAKFRANVNMPFPHPELPAAESIEEESERKRKRNILRDMMVPNLRALFGPEEIPWPPRRENGQLFYNGEELEDYDRPTAERSMRDSALKLAQRLWSNPDDLLNTAPYILLDMSGQYPNVVKMADELPAGTTLLATEEWWEDCPEPEAAIPDSVG